MPSEFHVSHLVDDVEQLNHIRGELWKRLDDLDIDDEPEKAAQLERAFRRVERDLADARDRILGRQPGWMPIRVPAGEGR